MAEKMRQYQQEMEAVLRLAEQADTAPRLLLHSCCAPCSSAVLEALCAVFDVTVYYDNPNLDTAEEFQRRVKEQRRLIGEMRTARPVGLVVRPYEPERFDAIAAGLEAEEEGGARCAACFALRLGDTAKAAKDGGFTHFTTTLTVSPHKNADVLNAVGEAAAARCGVRFLPSDFKKRGGYQRSLALSKQYALYRQDYCGCAYSRRAAEERKQRASFPPL